MELGLPDEDGVVTETGKPINIDASERRYQVLFNDLDRSYSIRKINFAPFMYKTNSVVIPSVLMPLL